MFWKREAAKESHLRGKWCWRLLVQAILLPLRGQQKDLTAGVVCTIWVLREAHTDNNMTYSTFLGCWPDTPQSSSHTVRLSTLYSILRLSTLYCICKSGFVYTKEKHFLGQNLILWILSPAPPHLLLGTDGSNVSQNALHLLLRHALADVVFDEAAERRPDGADVVLAEVALFVAAAPPEGRSGGGDIWWERHWASRPGGNFGECNLTRNKGAQCPRGTGLHIFFWTASCCLWWRWTCTGYDLHLKETKKQNLVCWQSGDTHAFCVCYKRKGGCEYMQFWFPQDIF